MNRQRRRASQLLFGLLLAGALVALILIGSSALRGGANPPDDAPTLSPLAPQTASRIIAVPVGEGTLLAQGGLSEDPARPTLQQEWAAAVFDHALSNPIGLGQAGYATLTWLQERGVYGRLGFDGSGLTLDGRVMDAALDQRSSLEIVLPDKANVGLVVNIARLERTAGPVTLTVAPAINTDTQTWTLSGNVSTTTILGALVNEAASRDVALVAGYWQTPGNGAVLALADLESAPQSADLAPAVPLKTPALNATASAGPSPTHTLIPTVTPSPLPTPSATATLVYEPELRALIAGQVMPIIAQGPNANRQSADTFALNHPWAGMLTQSATSPEVGGRALGLQDADSFYLFRLDSDQPVRLLEAHWDGDGTTVLLPDGSEQWFFGFRFTEMAHTLTVLAQESGGQWRVAYDRAGGYRALTLLDFEPLSLPP